MLQHYKTTVHICFNTFSLAVLLLFLDEKKPRNNRDVPQKSRAAEKKAKNLSSRVK
jgi:hypothetical protein